MLGVASMVVLHVWGEHCSLSCFATWNCQLWMAISVHILLSLLGGMCFLYFEELCSKTVIMAETLEVCTFVTVDRVMPLFQFSLVCNYMFLFLSCSSGRPEMSPLAEGAYRGKEW